MKIKELQSKSTWGIIPMQELEDGKIKIGSLFLINKRIKIPFVNSEFMMIPVLFRDFLKMINMKLLS